MGNICKDPNNRDNGNREIEVTVNKKKMIRVATLNYCGIMNSPFEFYCTDFQVELDQISDIFISLIPKYIPDFNPSNFTWKMGKIDLKLRTGRYSPMFAANVGIINGAFIGRHEFEQQWEKVFKIQVEKVRQLKYTQEQKQTTMLYDILMYNTLLNYVFKTDTIEQAKFKNPKDYLKKIEPFFELSFLDEKRKLDKMKQSFAKINADIFIFQEYSKYFYDYLEQQKIYHLVCDPTNDTLIITKKSVFPKQEIINNNEDRINYLLHQLTLTSTITMAVMIVDRCIILGVHLSSKKEKNKQQVQALRKGLVDLKKLLMENALDFQVILGGDLNSYFPQFSNKFNIYPQDGGALTTVKKRTMTQGQFHKGRKLVEETKDKIISSMPVLRGNIKYITNEEAQNKSLVPNDRHPFDHFVVVAELQMAN